MSSLRGRCAIAGVGQTACGKLPGVTTLSLHVEAVRRALADAGLRPSDADGLLTNQPIHDPHRCYSIVVAKACGIDPVFSSDLALGGATPVAMAQMAALAIDAGLCHTVVCVHARNMATVDTVAKKGTMVKRGNVVRDGWEEFEEPFGLIGPLAQHAFAASRHFAEFGTTSEQLAAVAVACRRHALLNPNASMKKPITVADHQNSPWIVEPLRLLDCSLISDGGGAFVVTSAERARSLRRRPAYILGMGQHHPAANLMQMESLTTLGGARSSRDAYAMAGLQPRDIDVAEIYDCFTITVLITLEDYGFCPKGSGGEWIQGGRIELGGELPVNTHGGLLSEAHVEGALHVVEAVRQLRGDDVEPERQVAGCETAIVSGHGGNLSTHATLILGREAS